ncbi:N-acetylmuramoyl-L-alanine amidase [Flammeovirga sp. SubArs3]|uniref:N-acetylmuramoyl-L-alanine amidase n=1 Tax=Flammeovirga sp. SubArs3 TaxID=2995316 RepID=UPI00248C0CA6|nr:N-acetylmuramoyl-L-alanine amidase [Flammeovirga sp. SubArs3]
MKISSIYKCVAIILCTLCSSGDIYAQINQQLAHYYKRRAKKYLVKSPKLYEYFSIDQRGIIVYASPAHRKQNRAEFYVRWDELSTLKDVFEYSDRSYQYQVYCNKGVKPFTPDVIQSVQILKSMTTFTPSSIMKPLSGIRVAIDPGHIAEDMKMAKVEGRFVDMKLKDGTHIQLKEGDLTLTTAYILKDSLEKYGAKVFLTRETAGNSGASKESYNLWKKRHLQGKLHQHKLTKKEMMHILYHTPESRIYRQYYLQDDLEVRAQKINYFKPDVTVVLHYNADELNVGWNKPSKRNFSMSFIPGSFLSKELATKRDRYDFLRILISDYTKNSYYLSKFVMEQFEDYLDVPAVDPTTEPRYLKNVALPLGNGIYARNLRLCRLLNSPMCYGEPLLQDNEKELRALNDNDKKNGNISPRVIEVANSYFYGILNYVNYIKSQHTP